MLFDMVRWRGHRLLNRTLSACKKTFVRVSGPLNVPGLQAWLIVCRSPVVKEGTARA